MQLIDIFKQVFGDENIETMDINHISIDTLPVWDSLKHLRLIMTLEEEYHLNLTPEDFQNFTSYTIINDYINLHKEKL